MVRHLVAAVVYVQRIELGIEGSQLDRNLKLGQFLVISFVNWLQLLPALGGFRQFLHQLEVGVEIGLCLSLGDHCLA